MPRLIASLAVCALVTACGAPAENLNQDDSSLAESDLAELADAAELSDVAALQQALTSQTTANNPVRILGFTTGCGVEGVQCTSNMPAGCTCLVPADKTVTFDIAPGSESLRDRASQMVDVMNSRFSASGWSFELFPPGDGIGEVTISESPIDNGFGFNDIRRYSQLSCVGLRTLAEPTALGGTFKTLGRCGLVVDQLATAVAGPPPTFGGQRVLRHALLHQMLKTVGLGLTGDSGLTATGPDINPFTDKVERVPGQDCLVNNFDATNPTQIALSNSARCPAFFPGHVSG